MQRFTLTILGLEKDIWEVIEGKEKAKYNLVAIFFLISMLIALLGIYFTMLIVTGSDIVQTVIASLFLFFIYFNIFRFSIITIRRSFFKNDNDDLNTLAQKEKNNLAVKQNLIAKINAFKPTFGNSVRTVVYLILIQILVFGLVVCSNFKSIKNESQIIRDNILQDYIKSVSDFQLNSLNKLKQSLETINNKITTLESMNGEQSIYFDNLLVKKQLIEKEIIELTLSNKKDLDDKSVYFRNKIEHKYFPLKIILNPKYRHSILFFELLLIIVFLIPIRTMLSLKQDEKYNYATLSNDKFRGIVKFEHQKLELLFNEKIKKYNKNAELFSIWEDVPFNSIYKKKFAQRTPVSLDHLLNQ